MYLKINAYLVVASVGLSACDGLPRPAAEESARDVVLARLTELQNELKSLRLELAQLRQAVTEIHRAAVRPATTTPPQTAARSVAKKVSIDDDPVLGNSEAKIAVVEFSDYQCPFCNRFYSQTLAKLKARYIDTGKVKYVFRDFPLAFHPQAKSAAVAANCAGKQNAYWKMHDGLFNNQRRLGSDLYEELAKNLRLDVAAFQACTRQGARESKEIDADLAYGQSIGVRGTPTFFIGRLQGTDLIDAKQITGAQPLSVFEQTIDPLLK